MESGFSNARQRHNIHHIQDVGIEDPVITAIRDLFHKVLKVFIVSTTSTWNMAS